MTAFNIAVRRAHFAEQEKKAGLYKLFAEHLSGSGINWFSKLEEISIDSFTQLSTTFVKQYSMFIEKVTSDVDLWALSQGQKNLLRDYLKKFNETLANMSSLNDHSALATFKCGFDYGTNLNSEKI